MAQDDDCLRIIIIIIIRIYRSRADFLKKVKSKKKKTERERVVNDRVYEEAVCFRIVDPLRRPDGDAGARDAVKVKKKKKK